METFVTVIIICVLSTILLSVVVWSIKNGISPMPSTSKAKKAILESSPSVVQGTICELGSGWGTLVLPLALRYPQCVVIGYESSPIPFFFSKIRACFSRRKNLILLRRDFFKESLSDAALVVCYLYPEAMRILRKKFEDELRPGTIIISNTFGIPGWEPIEVHIIDDMYKTKVYLYRR